MLQVILVQFIGKQSDLVEKVKMKFSILLVTFALFADTMGLSMEEEMDEIPTIVDGPSGIVQDDTKAQDITLTYNVIDAENDDLPVLKDRAGSIENSMSLLKWELILCRYYYST